MDNDEIHRQWRKQDVACNRFVEAVATGKSAGRRLSCGGLGKIRHCWHEALSQLVDEVKIADEGAQRRFMNSWTAVGFGMIRGWVDDDDLFFSALRILLPRYQGPSVELWRGQLEHEPVGSSWTRSLNIAEKFARFGTENVNSLDMPHHTERRPRKGWRIYKVEADSEHIICAPCLLGHGEGEYIIDPRGFSPEIACDWWECYWEYPELEAEGFWPTLAEAA